MRTAYQSHQCTGRLAGQYPRISPGNRAPFWPTACGAECPDPTVFRTSSANCCRSSKRRESSRVGSWWDARKYFAISVANLWRSSIRSLSQHSCLQSPLVRTSVSEDTNFRIATGYTAMQSAVMYWSPSTRPWNSGSTRSGNRHRTRKIYHSIRTWPADRISLLRDGGFDGSSAVLNCCLSAVQQLAGLGAQVRSLLPPHFVSWGCRCPAPEPTLWTRITIAPDARPARRRFPGGGHLQQLLAGL